MLRHNQRLSPKIRVVQGQFLKIAANSGTVPENIGFWGRFPKKRMYSETILEFFRVNGNSISFFLNLYL